MQLKGHIFINKNPFFLQSERLQLARLNIQCIEQEIYGETDFRHNAFGLSPLSVTENLNTNGLRKRPKRFL